MPHIWRSALFMSYLQNRSSAQYSPLHPAGIALLAERSQTVDQEVGALSLAWAALSRDDNALVDPLPEHGIVSNICDSKDMGLQFAQLVVLIHLDILRVVDGQKLKGVDGNEDAACIGVDLLLAKACSQVV